MIVGPDNELDELAYIQDALHQRIPNFDRNIPSLMAKLSNLQDKLKRQGKRLLIVTTPSKAITYPQTIPSRFLSLDRSSPRPYDQLIAALQHSDLPFIDGAEIIHHLAATSPYPLFTQGGIHWNDYAAIHVLQPLLQKISELTRKPLPVPSVKNVHYIPAAQSGIIADTDLAKLLNVLRPPLDYPCVEATPQYGSRSAGAPPRFVFAGGSFCWQLLRLMETAPRDDLPLPAFAFYANQFSYTDSSHPISRQVYEAELGASDLVVLEINELVPIKTIERLPALIDDSPQSDLLFANDISFAADGNAAKYIASGFGAQEPAGRWTNEKESTLMFFFPTPAQNYCLTATVDPFLYGSHLRQRVDILANGQLCGHAELNATGSHIITASFLAQGWMKITFRLPDAISPVELGANPDQRSLGLAFHSIHLAPAKVKGDKGL